MGSEERAFTLFSEMNNEDVLRHYFFTGPDPDAGHEYISEAEVQVEKLLSEVSVFTAVFPVELYGGA